MEVSVCWSHLTNKSFCHTQRAIWSGEYAHTKEDWQSYLSYTDSNYATCELMCAVIVKCINHLLLDRSNYRLLETFPRSSNVGEVAEESLRTACDSLKNWVLHFRYWKESDKIWGQFMYCRSPVTHFLHTDYNILFNYKKNVDCVTRFGSVRDPWEQRYFDIRK
jgi:hypothetical protein